jgi:hypothetical protein
MQHKFKHAIGVAIVRGNAKHKLGPLTGFCPVLDNFLCHCYIWLPAKNALNSHENEGQFLLHPPIFITVDKPPVHGGVSAVPGVSIGSLVIALDL